LLVLANY